MSKQTEGGGANGEREAFIVQDCQLSVFLHAAVLQFFRWRRTAKATDRNLWPKLQRKIEQRIRPARLQGMHSELSKRQLASPIHPVHAASGGNGLANRVRGGFQFRGKTLQLLLCICLRAGDRGDPESRVPQDRSHEPRLPSWRQGR